MLGAAAFGRYERNLPRLARNSGHESDPLPVRRPARQGSLHRWKTELKPLAAVHLAPPQGAIWKRHISDPLTILGKTQALRRNPGKIGHKLLRLRVIPHQFAARLPTQDEQPLSVFAGKGPSGVHRTGCHLGRHWCCSPEEAQVFPNSPDIGRNVVRIKAVRTSVGRSEEKVLAVERPD